MASCAKCGATLSAGATFCGSCGTPVSGAAAGSGSSAPGAAGTGASSSGLSPNVAALLSYFTIIGAIIFMVLQPYNKDRFVRFHAFQSLFFHIAWVILWVASVIVAMVPVIGWIISIFTWLVLGLGGFVLWVFLVYKAYNNEKFQLPVIGKIAEEQASK